MIQVNQFQGISALEAAICQKIVLLIRFFRLQRDGERISYRPAMVGPAMVEGPSRQGSRGGVARYFSLKTSNQLCIRSVRIREYTMYTKRYNTEYSL
jgi:hypothetical protein